LTEKEKLWEPNINAIGVKYDMSSMF